MFSDDFKTTWIEFNSQVYVGGEGYTSSIKTDPDPTVGPGRSLAVTHWQDKGLWYFIMLDGCCVVVPNANVRYVYGKVVRMPIEVAEKIETEEETPETYISHKIFDHGPELTASMESHNQTIEERLQAELVQALDRPKRRGRPPKVKG